MPWRVWLALGLLWLGVACQAQGASSPPAPLASPTSPRATVTPSPTQPVPGPRTAIAPQPSLEAQPTPSPSPTTTPLTSFTPPPPPLPWPDDATPQAGLPGVWLAVWPQGDFDAARAFYDALADAGQARVLAAYGPRRYGYVYLILEDASAARWQVFVTLRREGGVDITVMADATPLPQETP